MATMDAEPVFVDTNVLVYAHVAEAPWHQQAQAAIVDHEAAGAQLWISTAPEHAQEGMPREERGKGHPVRTTHAQLEARLTAVETALRTRVRICAKSYGFTVEKIVRHLPQDTWRKTTGFFHQYGGN